MSAGKAKPSLNGEKERIQIRNGDNEFATGIFQSFINVLQIMDHSSHLVAFVIYDVNRKKGDNEELGMARRLIMISIKRQYANNSI